MRTNVVLSLFLLLAAVSSWGTECVCQLVNVKGSVLYKGPCLRIENKGTAENTFSRGSFFLKKSNSDIFQKSFQANVDNTLDRIRFDDKIDRAFVGKFIPVAVGRTKRYPEEVLKGRNEYYEMLKNERAK